jgi:hypothetical protein
VFDVAQQLNAGLFCCSKIDVGHQSGSRAQLLGSPDQRTVDRLNVKHVDGNLKVDQKRKGGF